jgi:hypothetical protein
MRPKIRVETDRIHGSSDWENATAKQNWSNNNNEGNSNDDNENNYNVNNDENSCKRKTATA